MVLQSVNDQIRKIRKGRYWNRTFRKRVLPQIASPRGILRIRQVEEQLRQQGFGLDPVRDNKSVYDPDVLFGRLARYVSPISWKPRGLELSRAYKLAYRHFARGESEEFIKPFSLNEARVYTHATKSSGSPLYIKKGEALEREIERAEQISRKGYCTLPCTAYHRTQHKETGPTTRLVWAYPMAMTLLEGRFAAPLINLYLKRRTPMAFGRTKLGLSARIRAIRNLDFQYSLDYSGFDSSIHPELIRMAFRIIRSWFSPEYKSDIDLLESYFINTLIVMPDGYIYRKERGVPSGSYFTQVVDSIVNFISVEYMTLVLYNQFISPKEILVLGDDSLFGMRHTVNLRAAANVLAEIGLTMNPLKVSQTRDGEDVHFLGHGWTSGLPHREPMELAKRMAYPERWDESRVKSMRPDPGAGHLTSDAVWISERTCAYLSDAVETYAIVRDFTWNQRLQVFQLAYVCQYDIPVTGWQLFMRSMGWDRLMTPSSMLYLGVFS